jgi:hypothetical protein
MLQQFKIQLQLQTQSCILINTAYTAVLAPLTPQIWGEQDSKSPSIGGFRGRREVTSVVYSFENGCKLLYFLNDKELLAIQSAGSKEREMLTDPG